MILSWSVHDWVRVCSLHYTVERYIGTLGPAVGVLARQISHLLLIHCAVRHFVEFCHSCFTAVG